MVGFELSEVDVPIKAKIVAPEFEDFDDPIGCCWKVLEELFMIESFGNPKIETYEFSIELMNITSLFRENVAGIEYNDNFEKDGEYHQMGFLPAFHINYRF
jgi:hypothetical protein